MTARLVTITDADRVVWVGSYADFQAANIDGLSVVEFQLLERDGILWTGGGAEPALTIQLHGPEAPAPTVR
jgi:hypothetical protein